MRKLLVALLNVAGVALIATAGVLAWNAYNPVMPPLPVDATVIEAGAAAVELPPPAPTSAAPSSAPTSAPAILPETKPRPPQQTPEPDERRQAQQARLAQRRTQGELDAFRAAPFPPPATAVPTRLILPSINVDSAIVEVGMKLTEQDGQPVNEWAVADYAVGFHGSSALPGASGNTVMAGHNNIAGEVFRNLSDMKVGDEVIVLVGEVPYRYQVTQKLLVRERGVPLEQRLQNAAWIAPTGDVRVTLVSCWPYTSNTYRIVIVAKPA